MRAKLMDWGNGEKSLRFWCEGCKTHHTIPVDGSRGWQWNGDLLKPTVTPSILERNGHYVPSWHEGKECWCTYNDKHPDDPYPYKCGVCHMFVTDGNAVYLGDCTHELAGQTIPLKELEE